MIVRLKNIFLITIAAGAQLGIAALAAFNPAEFNASAACVPETFSQWLPVNVSVERVTFVLSGDTYGEGTLDLNYPTQPTNLPELCAVTIFVQSSPISSYRFGVFLPTTWNERYLAIGNGGLGGGINWLDMGASVKYGFAVVSTDTGHNSTTGNGAWAYKNPQKMVDWGWRAMNGTVTISKGLVTAYYGEVAKYTYYNGCSSGGRQGLKQVQLVPDMFDGVIVGSSAWYVTHLNPWFVKAGIFNLPSTDAKYIDWHLYPAIGDLVIQQCDELDGVKDGMISSPNDCRPDFTKMACNATNANRSACLTETQIKTANNMYVDYYSDTGVFLFPGLSPGCEGQIQAIYNQTETSPFGINYLRYFLFGDPQYNWTMYNDSAIQLAVSRNPGGASVTNFNLTAFRDSGAKMLMYHGLADGLIPPRGSDWYYETVLETMGGNMESLQKYFRYFQVPGLQHCWNTPFDLQDGPWAFGGEFQATTLGPDQWSVPGYENSQHDILMAMMEWVENGTAIDSFVATTWEDPLNASTGVRRQRPVCPYPQKATWDGVGDTDDPSSWNCVEDQSVRLSLRRGNASNKANEEPFIETEETDNTLRVISQAFQRTYHSATRFFKLVRRKGTLY